MVSSGLPIKALILTNYSHTVWKPDTGIPFAYYRLVTATKSLVVKSATGLIVAAVSSVLDSETGST
jgi:hypothetical protein